MSERDNNNCGGKQWRDNEGEVSAWRLKKRERTERVDEAKSGADTPSRAG